MFTKTFNHKSETVLEVPIDYKTDDLVGMLHDFDTTIHTNVELKEYARSPDQRTDGSVAEGAVVYDCEDAISFVPSYLWSGTVKYKAIHTPVPDGCNIVVKAPAGFTSLNKWRIRKDAEGKRYLSIDTEQSCSVTYAFFVERFTPGSHQRQFGVFKETLTKKLTIGAGSDQ